jgi:hypothetical protein
MLLSVAGDLLHGHTGDALSLRYGTVLVRHEKCLQSHNLLAKLSHRRGKRVVLCTKDLDLLLQVGKPLLFALTTFERGDARVIVSKRSDTLIHH